MEEKKKWKKRATIFQTKRVLKYWDYERNKGLDPKIYRTLSEKNIRVILAD